MRYALFLRGINVGGKNKVVMGEFKDQLQGLGFKKVMSYINSGNFVFDSDEDHRQIMGSIQMLCQQTYAFNLPLALISQTSYAEDCEKLPAWWQEPFARKDVLFYTRSSQKEEIQNYLTGLSLGDEIVHIGEIACYWGKREESNFLKTAYHKALAKAPFYQAITIRNENTFEKIYTLLHKENNK